jgi:hypothetical protein
VASAGSINGVQEIRREISPECRRHSSSGVGYARLFNAADSLRVELCGAAATCVVIECLTRRDDVRAWVEGRTAEGHILLIG